MLACANVVLRHLAVASLRPAEVRTGATGRKWLIDVYEAHIASKVDDASGQTPTTKAGSSREEQSGPKKYTMEFYLSLLFHHVYYNSDLQNEVELFYRDHHQRRRTFARYRNYKTTGFTLPNFTFEALLSAIKPNRILDLMKFLLLEKKVLLIRDHYADNAVLIESLLMLLSPLYEWL